MNVPWSPRRPSSPAGHRLCARFGLALRSATALSGSRFFQSATLGRALGGRAPAPASSCRALRRRFWVYCAVRFARHGLADTALLAHSSDDGPALFDCCSRFPADELPTYDNERAYERAPLVDAAACWAHGRS
jgi:hypothetical protein